MQVSILAAFIGAALTFVTGGVSVFEVYVVSDNGMTLCGGLAF